MVADADTWFTSGMTLEEATDWLGKRLNAASTTAGIFLET